MERESEGRNKALPEIAKAKHVEKSTSQSSPSFLEDSGLELRGTGSSLLSRPSTAGSTGGRGWGAKTPPSRFTPSPPPGARGGAARSRPILTNKKPLDYVWVSKSELERTQETLTSLRSEAVQMQAQIRNLKHHEQDLATLQGGCVRAAAALGCSVEGVEAIAVKDILLTRIAELLEEHKRTTQQCDKGHEELEQYRGEVAAVNISLSSTGDQLKQATKERDRSNAALKQAKREVETLRQTCARTGATVESLRQQVTEVRGQAGKSQKEASFELTQLQADVGRLKRELAEKDDALTGWKDRFNAVEKERSDVLERLADSEAVYAELCVQLAAILQLDTTGSFDLEHLLSQVGGVLEECEELRLHCETMDNSIKTAEQDAKASRETILRLVSEGKQLQEVREKAAMLESEVEGRKASLLTSEQEKVCLRKELEAAKEEVLGLQLELEGKEERVSELHRSLAETRLASDSNKSLVNSVQSDLEVLVNGLAAVLSVQPSDTGVLLQTVKDLRQRCSQQDEALKAKSSLLAEHEATIKTVQASTLQGEQDLHKWRSKVKRLEGEVSGLEVVRDGLAQDLDKCRVFSKQVARAVGLEKETAEILATGDFAHDAIIMRAEQLIKLEGEALLSKQTAVYSLQRKLKACRQALQSRELHMSLLQRKTDGLEQTMKESGRLKMELEGAVNKMKKMEKQLERLQDKVGQQRSTIAQLEAEGSRLQSLKDHCHQLAMEQTSLRASREELEQHYAKQSQLLVEAKEKAKHRSERDGREIATLRAELEASGLEKRRLKEHEEKLYVFKMAVQRLLKTQREEEEEEELADSGDAPSDYDLLTSLEKLIGSQQRHRDNARCLEASLRQLEHGFKTSYKDTLTILSSD